MRPLNQIKQFIKRQRVKSNVQSVNQSSILVKASNNLANHPKADSHLTAKLLTLQASIMTSEDKLTLDRKVRKMRIADYYQ